MPPAELLDASSETFVVHRERPVATIQQHILQEQQRHPDASGEFTALLSGITLAAKQIQAQVRRAGLTDILGAQGDVNVQEA